jgi:hypothetical protein
MYAIKLISLGVSFEIPFLTRNGKALGAVNPGKNTGFLPMQECGQIKRFFR